MEKVKADEPRKQNFQGGCPELKDDGYVNGASVPLEVKWAELRRLCNDLSQFKHRLWDFTRLNFFGHFS